MTEQPTLHTAPNDGQGIATGIVVGLDGTPEASAALRWAVDHCDLFGTIRPILAWHYPAYVWLPPPVGSGAPPADTMQAAAESAAHACVEQVAPDTIVEPIVREGDAGPILVEESRDAAILVVGTRGHGSLVGRILGSVGRYCADHTTVPLVIVPGGSEASPAGAEPRRIVVGVDGSENSDAALRWAMRYSRPSDKITVHTTWHYVPGLGYETYAIEAPVLEAAAAEIVESCVARVSIELGISPDRFERVVDSGDPRTVLRSLGEDADLLVIGARGRSGLPHFFLGSTTTALVHRPVCPTVIVPPDEVEHDPAVS